MFGFFDGGNVPDTGSLPPAPGGSEAGIGTLLKLVSFLLVLGAIALLVAGWNQHPSSTADTCFWLGKRIGLASIAVFVAGVISSRYF